jgi:hypothetical protein
MLNANPHGHDRGRGLDNGRQPATVQRFEADLIARGSGNPKMPVFAHLASPKDSSVRTANLEPARTPLVADTDLNGLKSS